VVTVTPARELPPTPAQIAVTGCARGSHGDLRADAEAILSAGLDLLLARDAKNKALVEKPRSAWRRGGPDQGGATGPGRCIHGRQALG
jgi:hypothetical protein